MVAGTGEVAVGMEGRMGCTDSEELREAEGKMNGGNS